MKYSDNPKFMPVAFGINGQRQTLQSDSVTGTSLASYNAGFPEYPPAFAALPPPPKKDDPPLPGNTKFPY